MQGGASIGSGGSPLGRHLADAKGKNAMTEMGDTRHLGSDDLMEAVAELTQTAAGAPSRTPLYHVHADPAPTERFTAGTWTDYWNRFEAEFGFEDQAFVEARHWTYRRIEANERTPERDAQIRSIHGDDRVTVNEDKSLSVLMEHRHRVYSRLKEDGHLISLSHDFARREKLHRVFEHDHGFDMVKGAHNKAVAKAIATERPDVVNEMAAQGLLSGGRTRSGLTPQERAQQERTGVPKAEVQTAAFAAWKGSTDRDGFLDRMRASGLHVAMGDSAPVIIDRSGSVHRLVGILSAAAKDAGSRLVKADVEKRVGFDTLESVEAVRQAMRTPPVPPETPTPTPPDKPRGELPAHALASMQKAKARLAELAGRPAREHVRTMEDTNVRAEAEAQHEAVAGLPAGQAAAAGGTRPGQRVHDGESGPRRQGDGGGDGQALGGAGDGGADPATPGKRRGEVGGDGRQAERLDPANGRRRIEAGRLEAGLRKADGGRRVQELLASVQALGKPAEPKAAQPKASTKADGATPSVRVGNNATGGGGGGNAGKSMEAALHAGTGWIEAPEQSGGGEGAPVHEMDQDELNEASELTGRMFDRFLRWLGVKREPHAASEVRTVAEPKAAETLEPPKVETPKEAVEQPKQPIPDNVVKLDHATIVGQKLKLYAATINRGTIKDGEKQAKELDGMGDEAKQCVEALKRMHGAGELEGYAKELKHLPPSEAASRIRQKNADLLNEQMERRLDQAQQAQEAKHNGPKPQGPTPRMGR